MKYPLQALLQLSKRNLPQEVHEVTVLWPPPPAIFRSIIQIEDPQGRPGESLGTVAREALPHPLGELRALR